MLEVDDLFKDFEQKCTTTVKTFQTELDNIQIGRANTGIIEKIIVNMYGSTSFIRDLATINIIDSQTISVKVWDRSAAAAVEKAILSSDLNLSPIREGELIRIPIPPLTSEKRKKIAKMIQEKSENFKVSIRSNRHNCMDQLKKEQKSLAKDDYNNFLKKIDQITKKFIDNIIHIMEKKIKSILK